MAIKKATSKTAPAKSEMVWSLSDGQTLIAAMAAKAARFGYTPTLGGSVLTKGESKKNLNVFFVPNETVRQLPVDLLMWLASKFGVGKTIVNYPNAAGIPINRVGNNTPASKYEHRMAFDLDGRKIEVYVL